MENYVQRQLSSLNSYTFLQLYNKAPQMLEPSLTTASAPEDEVLL